MALSANREVDRFVDQELRAHGVVAGGRVYKGAFVGSSSGGYAKALAAGETCLGIAYEEGDNSAAGAADGGVSVRVFTQGDFAHALSGVTQADVGKSAYASDDATLTLVAEGNSYIGPIVGLIDSATAIVRLDLGNAGSKPHRFSTRTQTLTGAKTLGLADAQIQMLDPGGAGRDVTLPAEAGSAGLTFIIVNTADAAEDLTVKNAATATIATVAQNEAAVLVCNGTVWRSLVGANT